jgi:hypothetical protein
VDWRSAFRQSVPWRDNRCRTAGLFDGKKFRERVDNGDFYAEADYAAVIRDHFAHHGLSFDDVDLHRGFSDDPAIMERTQAETYHLVYVDGAHSFEGARHDFRTYGPKVVPGGWLVADDAGCDLPGTTFWKGHAAVTAAAAELPAMGFTNVLNVGHNRVYQRHA